MSRASLLSLGAAAFILSLAPFLSDFHASLLNYIGIFALATVGLILITGIGGITSLGQAAFAGMGAYTTAYLTTAYGLSPWIGLVVGIVLVTAAALLVGAINLTLSGHYIAVSTIAAGLGFYYVLTNSTMLGGNTGTSGVPSLTLFGFSIGASQHYFYIIWLVLFAAMLLTRNLLNSRPGRAIRSLRTCSEMAESFGVNTALHKIFIFTFAAVMTGVSGWLYAHFIRFVNPTPFGLHNSIEYLFMAVVGGVTHLWGAVVGAAIIVLLKDWLQDLIPFLLGRTGHFETIVFGVLMILLFQRASGGVLDLASGWGNGEISKRKLAPLEGMVPPLSHKPKPGFSGPLLEVRGITRKFGGLVAVNALSFELRRGEILGLIGPNGAGKSTAFAVITGLQPADEGDVRFLGQTLHGKSPRQIARLGIARSFQHPQFVTSMSVIENVMAGAYLRGEVGFARSVLRFNRVEETAIHGEAMRQLRRVGLEEMAYVPAGGLPLGKQRLLEVARALAADPAVLMLDEPAAGLRGMEKEALSKLLAGLRAEGMSILLVEHDMGFVMDLVDRLVVVDFGRKIAEGVPADIQRDEKVIEIYLGGIDDLAA